MEAAVKTVKTKLEETFPHVVFQKFQDDLFGEDKTVLKIKIKKCTVSELDQVDAFCREKFKSLFNIFEVSAGQYVLETCFVDDQTLEVGVDEVGRGALIFDVYAAAVYWDPEVKSDLIKDSKKMNHRQRLIAADFIKENCLGYGVASASAEEIDEMNILQASMTAMHRAIKASNIVPQHILADGTHFNLYETDDGDFVNHSTIIEGDGKYYSIAAASILAKVERDTMIDKLCDENPRLDVYDLRSNKGYGSAKHRQAIHNWGISKWHRKTFGICKEYAG